MTEAMPFLQKYDITFLRPPTIWPGNYFLNTKVLAEPATGGLTRGKCFDCRCGRSCAP